MKTPALLILTLCAVALPAVAQEAGDDWDLTREGRTTMAFIGFNEGIGVAVRCRTEGFDLILVGLPPAPPPTDNRMVNTRRLEIGLGSEAPFFTGWVVGDPPTAATATVPGYLARTLRQGGMFRVIIPATDTSPRSEYRLPLPRSEAAVNTVLTACNLPLEDARDVAAHAAMTAGSDLQLEWRVFPHPEYPERAQSRGATYGRVHLSCFPEADGRLTDCRAESEYPPGMGFAQSAVRSLRGARLANPIDDTSRPLFFMVSFRVD